MSGICLLYTSDAADEAPYQPYELLDAWLSSDDPEIRKQADCIDEEGNNVLIRIRLKKK